VPCAAFQCLAEAMFSQLPSAPSSVLADLLSQCRRILRSVACPEGAPSVWVESLCRLSPRAVSHNPHVVSPLFSCIVLRAEKLGAKWAQIDGWLVSKGSRINVNFAECW